MSDIVITDATVEDIDTMVKWGNENWQLWGDDESKWYTKDMLIEWIENKGRDILLVAKVEGKLAGMCTTNILHGWAMCDSMYVDTPFRNKGVGRMLLEKAIKRVRALDLHDLMLLVDVKNPKGLEFYKKIGFRQGHTLHYMNMQLKEGR